jgi:hypothetical protein
LVVGFTPIIYLDNTGFHLFSDPTKVPGLNMDSAMQIVNYIPFKGKLYALIIQTYGGPGGWMWVTK